MAEQPPDWQRLTLAGIRERLVLARTLLQQAAAVGLAQDVDRMETLAELQSSGDTRGDKERRRYR